MDERQASLLVIGADNLERDQVKGLIEKYADRLDGIQIIDFEDLPEDTQKKVKKKIEIEEEIDLSIAQAYHNLASLDPETVFERSKDLFDDTPFYKKIHQKGGKKNKRNRWKR